MEGTCGRIKGKQNMKIWLDDDLGRAHWFGPEWVHCRWPADVIHWLQTGTVTELSLDHDLEDTIQRPERTGYDVVLWIEKQVKLFGFVPPIIRVHSMNGPARVRMRAAIEQIENA
jgi:hypothetical protein